MFKRLSDIILSFLILIITSPLFGLIAILIKLNSKGPVFYRGVRTGRFGKPFKIYKFRTMVDSAEKLGGPSTADNDPRNTKIGKPLRKYKLDELPQLINILCGEMSFVGPRPQVEKYTKLYSEEEKIILNVRPGMTDYATIHFINLDEILGNKNVDKVYKNNIEPEKNKLRIKYVKHHSLLVDFKIIIQTFSAILKTTIFKK